MGGLAPSPAPDKLRPWLSALKHLILSYHNVLLHGDMLRKVSMRQN